MMTFWVIGYGRCFFFPASTNAMDANRAKQSNKDITCQKGNKQKENINLHLYKQIGTNIIIMSCKKCLDSQFEIEKHGGENPKEREKLQPHELTLN